MHGSSLLPFIGIGTFSINYDISPFSSSLIGIWENSNDYVKTLNNSITLKFGFKY